MCGRIVQTSTPDAIAAWFGAELDATLREGSHAPRWNLAPTSDAVVVVPTDGRPRVQLALWGIEPRWGRASAPSRRLFNARAETVDRLPSFREAFRRGRMIVPADAFYEWENPEHLAARGRTTAPAGRRQPWAFLPTGAPLLALAGISVGSVTPDGERIRAVSLITTEANAVVGAIHDRMPAMVFGADLARWLDPETPRDELFALLGPAPDAALVARRVSTAVSNARNEGADLLDEVEPEPRLF